ncbi:MAG: extensin family protein [Xanthobacteraceae bacterium]|nr:extensin family protein [Xanthobacteraceae bacterium]QYK45474.1 MAG: extensin family protein [Xanthobacteraceae bacterium]
MARGRLYIVAPLVALGLVGCRGAFTYEERAPWRTQAEEQCVAQNLVRASAYTSPVPEISGPSACGMNHPFKVSADLNGQVNMQPQATLGCPMTAAFNKWLNEIAQPAAQAWFGEQIVEVKQLSSYSCRRIGGYGTMSEHGFGNALDVAGFTFQSGRKITVKDGWHASPEERGFLRQVHAGACEVFTTVLGPGYNAAHHDHFHFDLARRNSVVCRPTPQPVTPPNKRYRQDFPPMVQQQLKQQKQQQKLARVNSDYEDDDEEDLPPQPAPRARNQPLDPSQAYPPPQQQPQPQQRNANAPLVLNPQDPSNYPSPGGQPQYLQQPIRQQQLPPPQQQPVQAPQQYPPQYPPQQPQQPNLRWEQGPPPAPYNPNRPVPPGRVGNVKTDPTVTGSVKNRKHYKDVPATKQNAPRAVPGED